jgi:hypothetical protein
VSLSAGVHVITASVSDGDGGAGSDTAMVTVNALPVVAIAAPADGTTVNAGAPVDLSGTASDLEDGDLAAQIAWSSDVDGALGMGGSVTGVSLSTGVHVITASVTDGDGAAGSDTITLTVQSVPMVNITAPADGTTVHAGTPVDLSATGTDAEDGDLTAQIEWSSDRDGALGTDGSLTGVSLSAGVHLITASVTDDNGATGTDTITVTVNAVPVVTIGAPTDGTTVPAGTPVDLSATATDAEDGDLTAQIEWISDRDGALGSDGTLTGVTLSAGVHLITASVTDDNGATGSDVITVTVTP